MEDTKKERNITPKLFAKKKLSGVITAEAFLAKHLEWLKTHEFLVPILNAYEKGELFPTPTFKACQDALLSHVIAIDLAKANDKIEKIVERAKQPIIRRQSKAPVEKEKKVQPYTITIYCKVFDRIEIGKYQMTHRTEDAKTEKEVITIETKDMIYSETLFQRAMGLADRRLSGREDGVYAEIRNNIGKTIITRIERLDSVARIGRKPKGSVCKVKPKTTKNLSFGVSCHQDTCSFSRG